MNLASTMIDDNIIVSIRYEKDMVSDIVNIGLC